MANGSFILDFLLEHKENVFFETDASIQKVLTYACALGNTNGGTIVLGVKDSGETIGLPEAYSDEVVKQLNEKILPALPYTLTVMEREGKAVAIMSVWEGADKPYLLEDQIYLKDGDVVVVADSAQSMRMINRKLSIGNSWERIPIYDASAEDISESVIDRFRRQMVSDNRISQDASTTEIMSRLGFINMGNVTNSGVAVTAKEPTAFFPQARIRVSVFGGNDILQNVRLYEANLVESIDPIVDFIYSLYPQKVEVNGLLRQVYESIPKVALREGILNAVVHRRYDDYQTFMRVNIYQDHLEIVNSGQLPEGMSVDDLSKRHFSQLRNPDIANAFYVLRYIEAAGSGTLRIIEECKKNLCAMPEWHQGDNTVTLVFKANLPLDNLSGTSVIDNIIAGLTPNVETQRLLTSIHVMIKNVGNIKVADVQKLTGKSYASCKRYLQWLKEAGLIEYRGSLKTGGWFEVIQ